MSGTILWGNAWAAHHTPPRGPRSGAERMRRLARLVTKGHIGLGTLAELERPQIRAFERAAPTYRLLVGGRGMTDGVFWRDETYELVADETFRGFTYGGRRVRVPVAVLRHRASGRLLGMMAVHNPLDRWNARAFGRQLREVRRLRAAYGGISVLLAGDFNARAPVACRARRAGLFSAGHRRCRGWVPIDQLLVERGTRISDYRRMSGRVVTRITDHPALYRARFRLSGGR
jgi:endonuclease/exonuclease/phosphatase (EEP) superfamily protein YafD